jgi:hypothetical protein
MIHTYRYGTCPHCRRHWSIIEPFFDVYCRCGQCVRRHYEAQRVSHSLIGGGVCCILATTLVLIPEFKFQLHLTAGVGGPGIVLGGLIFGATVSVWLFRTFRQHRTIAR